MQIHDVVKKTRDALGKTQDDIAGVVKIKRQALQRFEKGRGGLPPDTLRKIADLIHLDPDYVAGTSLYPFRKSKNLIKMFIQEGLLLEGLEPLYWISEFNKKINLVALIASVPELKRYKNLGLPLVYALTFTDDIGNVFLLRRKKERDIINLAGDFPHPIVKLISTNCILTFSQADIGRDLYAKIRDWDAVSRRDIEDVFKKLDFVEVSPPGTFEEQKQLKLQRSMGIEPLSELDLLIIKAMRDERVPHESILKFLRGGNL